MKILLICIISFLLQSKVFSSLEGTRDWGAFSDLNSDVNTWLREGADEEVKARYIKLLFFRFWVMYYGPDAYSDDEAKAVRKYFELKIRGTHQRLDFTKADFSAILGIEGISDKELASDHASLRSFRLKQALTVGQLRGVISDFEKWTNEVIQPKK